MILTFISIATAAENITYDSFLLYAPTNYTISHTINNDTTYKYPISCMHNDSLCPQNITIINKTVCVNQACEIERTLDTGERYIKDTDECQLDIKCESCPELPECEMVDYKVRWRWYTDNQSIHVINLNEDDERIYPRDENFDFENEYTVQCPAIEKETEDFELTPLNFSKDYFYYYCLQPFGSYYDHYNNMSIEYLKLMTENNRKMGECQESLRTTAEKLGECKADYSILKEQYNQCEKYKPLLDNATKELGKCHGMIQQTNEDDSKYKTFFWILAFVNGFIAFIIYIKVRATSTNKRLFGGD